MARQDTHLTQTGAEVQALLDKVEGIEAGAQVNDIEKIKVNGTEQSVENKAVDIAVPEIFVAEYNVTTQAEIESAITAGKTLLARHNGFSYTYCGLVFGEHGGHRFCRVDTSTGGYASIYFVYCSGSEWGTHSFELEATGHKVTTLSAQSTDSKYPSAKAVYEAIKSVDYLTNYYLKSETYTKAEVAALIRAIQQFHYETYASTASVTNPQGNVLYLIGPTGSGEDKYEEYVYDVTKQNPWVKIGDTSIDLSGFVTISDLDTALSAYTTSAELETILEDYVTSDDLENLLEEKQSFGSGTSFPQNPKEGDVFVLTSNYIHDIEDTEIEYPEWPYDLCIYYTPNVAGKLRVQLSETWEVSPTDCYVQYGSETYQFQDYDLHVFDIPDTVQTIGFVDNDPGGMIPTSVLSFEYPAGVYEYDGIRWDRKISIEDKESWNNKYDKPIGGVPKTDLASAVQTSLGKADTAYQKPQNGIPASDLADGVIPTVPTDVVKYSQQSLTDEQKTQARTNIGAGTYSKPSGGIPKTDLDSGVKASLELADSAIQPAEFNELEEEVGTIGNGAYEEAWDGSSAPVVADIPAGVSVTYSNTSYTGTLAASASTVDKIYLVSDGNGNYDRYVTVEIGGTYSWKKVGTTAIPLSNYATKSEVDQLGQIVSETIPLDMTGAQAGVYRADTSTLIFVSLAAFDTKIFAASPGERFAWKSLMGAGLMAAVIFADVNDNVLEVVGRGSDEVANTYQSGIAVAPSGTAKFAYTTRRSALAYIARFHYIESKDLVSKEAAKPFIKTKSPNIWNGQTEPGVITTGGGISASGFSNPLNSGLIPVTPGHYYYLSGRSGDISSIRCLKADKTTIAKVLVASTGAEAAANLYYYLPSEDGSAAVYNGQFKVPSDCVYVQFSLSMNNSTYGNPMLEDIGDTYVANFVPSPYQPYDATEVINPSRVPGLNAAVGRKFPLNVLLIGSSHGMNTISQFPWIAYKNGFDVVVGNVYQGSLTLQLLAEAIQNGTALTGWFKMFSAGFWNTIPGNPYFDNVIKAAKWDYIILQRSASDDETWTAEQSAALGVIIERIKVVATNNPTILFNTGFADPSADQAAQIATTERIINSAEQMADEFMLEYIPVATAVQNARLTSLAALGNYTQHQLCYDTQHLDYGIGCYVAGATLFEFIFKKFGHSVLCQNGYGSYDEQKSFVGGLVDTGGTSNAYTEPTTATMEIAKYCAMAACRTPDAVSTTLPQKYPIE